MPILPVLDLKQGQVVRGIAGRREQYRPIVSRLTNSTEPRDVARAVHEHFGFTELYVADLDAIGGAVPARELYEGLCAEGYRLWVDAGVRTAEGGERLLDWGASAVVVGLETMNGPEVLRAICGRSGPQHVVFSLDLMHGQPLGNLAAWGVSDPWAIAQRAIEAGVGRLLVLDLAHVGIGDGTPTVELCRRLRDEHPHLEIATGGGVRGPDDIRHLFINGVDYVLVASALHDGRLNADSIRALQVEFPP